MASIDSENAPLITQPHLQQAAIINNLTFLPPTMPAEIQLDSASCEHSVVKVPEIMSSLELLPAEIHRQLDTNSSCAYSVAKVPEIMSSLELLPVNLPADIHRQLDTNTSCAYSAAKVTGAMTNLELLPVNLPAEIHRQLDTNSSCAYSAAKVTGAVNTLELLPCNFTTGMNMQLDAFCASTTAQVHETDEGAFQSFSLTYFGEQINDAFGEQINDAFGEQINDALGEQIINDALGEQISDALREKHRELHEIAKLKKRVTQEMSNAISLRSDYSVSTNMQISTKSIPLDTMLSKSSTSNSTCLQTNNHPCRRPIDTWIFERTLCVSDKATRISCARGIAAATNNNTFVVGDSGQGKVKVFDLSGKLIVNTDIPKDPTQSQVSQIRQVVVGLDDKCFVTDKTRFVRVFDGSGRYLHKFITCPSRDNIALSKAANMLPQLSGLAIDYKDCLLVGEVKTKYISRHSQDGSHLKTIRTTIKPWYIAAQHQQIIISSPIEQTVQVVDQLGRLLRTLHGPDTWMPTGVCCSFDTIYVCNFASDCNGVYAFSLSGEYLGCATREVSDATGVALVEGGKKLVVAQWGRAGVKLFTRN